MSKETYVFALDLSLNCSGIAIFTNDGELMEVSSIPVDTKLTTQEKLFFIAKEFGKYIAAYPPSEIAIENSFSRFNTSTQQLYRVHGVANLLFHSWPQYYYASTEVKKEVTQKGNAKKEQVRDAISKLYPKLKFGTFDESDAIAIGITHFAKRKG